MLWLPFVWAAIVAAGTAGFGYGAAAFAALAARVPLGPWWPATIQAHGHLQIFGWGGLMVLGVGFFFLPRLRGAPLAAPGLLPWVLGLMAGGLALRGIAQPALGLAPLTGAPEALAASGLLELAAATLALGILAATARRGPPLRGRPGLGPVLPYLATGFAALWLALAANAGLSLGAALEGRSALPAAGDALVMHLGLVGFLVPVSVAMSARTFPLFLWLRVPSVTLLRVVFVPFLLGLALRSAGLLLGTEGIAGAGALLEAVAFIAFPVVLHVVPLRRREGKVPTTDPHYLKPAEWLLVPSYFWLALAGLGGLLDGAAAFGLAPYLSPDLQRHALGSGFITLLILGMGARMLPGFSGKRVASVPLVWATVWLGNLSALLRVAPVALVIAGGPALWPFGPPAAALALSGALGLAAVVCFGLNLCRTFKPGAAAEVRGRNEQGYTG